MKYHSIIIAIIITLVSSGCSKNRPVQPKKLTPETIIWTPSSDAGVAHKKLILDDLKKMIEEKKTIPNLEKFKFQENSIRVTLGGPDNGEHAKDTYIQFMFHTDQVFDFNASTYERRIGILFKELLPEFSKLVKTKKSFDKFKELDGICISLLWNVKKNGTQNTYVTQEGIHGFFPKKAFWDYAEELLDLKGLIGGSMIRNVRENIVPDLSDQKMTRNSLNNQS